MKRFFATLVYALLTIVATAQQATTFDVDASSVDVDRLGNIYLVKDNVVSKYDKDMNFLCSYDNYPAGSISSVDVSNPFKVIVFYSEFNKLIYLDNKLSELRSPVLLDDLDLYGTKVVCSSSFGGFWAFDEQNICVRRISSELDISQQGTSIYDQLGDANVVGMKESNSYLFSLADDGRILILDKFGNFYRTLKTDCECSDFCIDNDILYYSCADKLTAYSLSDDSPVEIPFGNVKIDGFRIRHDQLYVLSGKKLFFDKIQVEK